MIQRIQTLWLLLAAFLVFLTIKLPFYSGTDAIELTFRKLTGATSLGILILSSSLGTFILVTLFMFKHRKIQMRFIWIAIVAECLIGYLYYRQTASFSEGGFSLWAILHPLILISLVMAARGIHKDAKLLRESDRIR